MEYPLLVFHEPSNRNISLEVDALDGILSDFMFYPDGIQGGTWDAVGIIVDFMEMHGFFLTLKSPWVMNPYLLTGDAAWWAGFTPHGTSGFNGMPDYYASGPSGPIAVARAAALCWLEAQEKKEE